MDRSGWNVLEEDGDEDGYRQDNWKSRDYLIFMIDCSESMLKTKMEDGENVVTCFDSCVKVVANVYNMRCVTGDKDYLGVLLYNTKESMNSHNFEHIYVFNDLSLPGASQVKQLEAVLTEQGKRKFMGDIGSEEAKLDEAFWMAGTMFSTQGTKEGTKRIVLFTNRDNPHDDDPVLQRRVIQKIKDLLDQNIGVSILPTGNEQFDWTLFYQTALGKSAAECSEGSTQQYEELLDRTMRKSYKRRPTSNVTFQLGPGVELGVGLFNLYSTARIPTAIKLDRASNEPIAAATTYMDDATAEKVSKIDLKKAREYGGKKIIFDKEEISQLTTDVARDKEDAGFGSLTSPSPSLVLLGFKPQTYLKPYHYIQPGFFAYPEEKHIKGSSKLFRALLERCAARNVMAICRMVARGNTAPILVALLPQLEEFDEDGYQISSPGFHVVKLPFADDIRDLQKFIDQRTPIKAEVDQVNKAKAMIRKLKRDKYNPQDIPNPRLQTHYRAVEAIALDRESVEPVDDRTQPDVAGMKRKAKHEIEEFINAVYPEDRSTRSKGKKTASGDAAGKKAKIEDIDLEEETKAHKLEKLTLPRLRELANQSNIKLSGTRKADIINQIYSHFGV